ncbi:MAG: GNAT family N-acetyltransferase [Chloroflexi bacterium]|nr:GNAT family N-acetyltransferase [Chloroflexota bacterium]
MPDGPRALREDEWGQLDELVSAVFRPEMFHDYPQLFNEANRANLRVVADDGKVVSHVGMTERPASLGGCRVDVACIGAVATYEANRGRGYASLAFQDCCDKAAADGIDVMMISGGRGLYTRVGCRQVGDDAGFALSREATTTLADARAPGGHPYAIAPVGPEHIAEMRALYEDEVTHFLRTLEDWQMALHCRMVMNTASDFWGVFVKDTLAAYLIVHQPDKIRRRSPDDPRTVRVVEFAGHRPPVAAALPQLLDHYGAQRLTIHVQRTDAVFRKVLAAATGTAGTPNGTSGTLRVINFPQLMERCRPLLAGRIGGPAAAELQFEADERPGSALGGFTIRRWTERGAESLRIPDLATAAQYLFGSTKPLDAQPEGSAALAELMARALPLPSLWYGISYV